MSIIPDCPCGLSGFFASTHLNYRAALKIKKSLHINPHRNHRHAGHFGFYWKYVYFPHFLQMLFISFDKHREVL